MPSAKTNKKTHNNNNKKSVFIHDIFNRLLGCSESGEGMFSDAKNANTRLRCWEEEKINKIKYKNNKPGSPQENIHFCSKVCLFAQK